MDKKERLDNNESFFQPYIVGVCGGTGSGKTYICTKIQEKFKEIFSSTNVTILSQDSYYIGGDSDTNYDIPYAIDFNLLISHVCNLMKGNPIDCPIYDFSSHSRLNKTLKIYPTKIIVIEGILIFTQEKLRNLCNLKVFINARESTRLFRRLKRDIEERGRSVDEVSLRYERDVAPSYEQYVLPSAQYSDMTINNYSGSYVGLAVMLDHLIKTVSELK